MNEMPSFVVWVLVSAIAVAFLTMLRAATRRAYYARRAMDRRMAVLRRARRAALFARRYRDN